MIYLAMLQLWLMFQLLNKFIFQKDVCPTHFQNKVWWYLNATLPRRWLGHALKETNTITRPHGMQFISLILHEIQGVYPTNAERAIPLSWRIG